MEQIDRRRPWAKLTVVPSKGGDRWEMRTSYPKADGTFSPPSRRRLGLVQRGREPIAGALTRRDAERLRDDWLASARRGELGGQLKVGATLGDAAEAWLDHRKTRGNGLSATTERTYRSALDCRILPHFGSLSIESVTAPRVTAWLGKRIKEGKHAPATLNRDRAILHGIFEFVRRAWTVNDRANPIDRVDVVADPSAAREPEAYTAQELWAIVESAPSDQWRVLIATAGTMGLRLGEVIALRWSDLDLSAGIATITRNRPADSAEKGRKSGHGVVVPVHPVLVEDLARLSLRPHFTAPADLVFPNGVGRFLSQKQVRTAWDEAVSTAGARRLPFKALRATCATLVRQNGSPALAAALLGHRDDRVTQRHYIQLRIPSGALDAIDAAFYGKNAGS